MTTIESRKRLKLARRKLRRQRYAILNPEATRHHKWRPDGVPQRERRTQTDKWRWRNWRQDEEAA